MKTKWLSLALVVGLAAVTVLSSGCGVLFTTKDTGPITTRDYDINGFTAVDIGSAFTVEITRADAFSVKITAREGLFKQVRVDRVGITLRVSLAQPNVLFGAGPFEADITMPTISGMEISGATEATVSGFESDQPLKVEVSGASTLELDATVGDLTADISGASHVTALMKAGNANIQLSGGSELRLDAETGDFLLESSGASHTAGQLSATATNFRLEGGSELQLTGSGGSLRLNEAGASQADLVGFALNNVDADLSGGSRAELDLNGTLNVSLSGASVLTYGGHPTLGTRVDIAGGSRLQPR